jgi:hypothetical protein
LLTLYEQGYAAHRDGGADLFSRLAAVHQVLARDYPDEWLLRWNLLESLRRRNGPDADQHGAGATMQRRLRQELGTLEQTFQGREPIASGLRVLSPP